MIFEPVRPRSCRPSTGSSSRPQRLGAATRRCALRRAVFCDEQGIFAGDDRDAIDDASRMPARRDVVLGGAPDEVVGTVRIHEAEPGVWWGSRLAVHAAYRRHRRASARR